MTAQEVKRAIATRLAVATTRVQELSDEEERLLGLLQETRKRLARAREEEARMRETDQRYNGIAPEHLRDVIRQLGTFTVSELASELGCSQPLARKQLETMLTAAWVVPAGRVMGKAVYEYRRPAEPGDAFEAQQRLREQETSEVHALAMARPEVKQSLIGSVSTKELRAVVREAVAAGWTLEHTGGAGHHLRLVKGKRRINVPSTPRNAGVTAAQMRQKLFETSSRQFLREASHAGR